MTTLHGSRVKRAELLVSTIQEGRLTAPGQLKAWTESAAVLPPKLREWVFQKIEGSIGPSGVTYLRSLLPEPVNEVAA
jgi:hypothetical protein